MREEEEEEEEEDGRGQGLVSVPKAREGREGREAARQAVRRGGVQARNQAGSREQQQEAECREEGARGGDQVSEFLTP